MRPAATSCTTCCARSVSSTSSRSANVSSRGSTRPPCCASCSASAGRSACGWPDASASSPPTRPASTGTHSGRRPPAGCRRRSWRRWRTPSRSWWRATPAPTARSRRRSCTSATASTPGRCCASSSARERSFAASCAPAAASASGATSRSCGACAGPRWRLCARRSSRPSERRLAAFLPAWQGIDRRSRAGAGVDRLREVLVPLQGLALPLESWERDVIPRRTGAYSPAWLDELCASGELAWVGAGPLGRSRPRGALLPRGRPHDRTARRAAHPRSRPRAVEHELLRGCLQRGPCFFSDLLAALRRRPPRLCARRSGTSCGPGR